MSEGKFVEHLIKEELATSVDGKISFTEKGIKLINQVMYVPFEWDDESDDEFSEVECLGVEAGEVSSFCAILPEMGEEYRDIWVARCELCGDKKPCKKCGGE